MSKQSQKKHSGKSNKQDNLKSRVISASSSAEHSNDKRTEKFEMGFKNKRFRSSIPFAIAFVFYAFLWIIPPGAPVKDPWFAAVQLVDSSNKINEANEKSRLLELGGSELKRLVELHPYHARVHFFLGYYYFVKHDWDSALVELKEAARIDSGSSINSIWPNAHDLIVKSAINKATILMSTGKAEEGRNTLLEIYKYGEKDPLLNKYLGNIYLNTGEYNIALRHLMSSLNRNPKDPETANLIGIAYKMLGDADNAAAYFRRALQLNPNHAGAKENLASMNK